MCSSPVFSVLRAFPAATRASCRAGSTKAPEKAACVVIPEIPAGSVVLFTEAVMTRHGTVASRSRAPDAALQVLRPPHGVVAGARAAATRRSAHPAAAGAPHRAGGSPHVRPIALQRRAGPGALGGSAASPSSCSSSAAHARHSCGVKYLESRTRRRQDAQQLQGSLAPIHLNARPTARAAWHRACADVHHWRRRP